MLIARYREENLFAFTNQKFEYRYMCFRFPVIYIDIYNPIHSDKDDIPAEISPTRFGNYLHTFKMMSIHGESTIF